MKNLFFFCFLFPFASISQMINGVVSEKLTDGKEVPVAFANVYVKEKSIGASTDFDGKFSLALPAGTYTLEITFVGYKKQNLTVQVENQKTTNVFITMESNSEVMEDFVLEAKLDRESKTMDILTTKQASGLENNFGAKKIEESGASSASDATKKIVGLSVVGSGAVYVRGLGDRYNAAYLNGLPLASLDPDQKVIPLDVFPSSVIQSLSVKKSYTANLEGDFSGGAIDIKTKDFPEEKVVKVSLGSGFNSQTLWKDVLTYEGGKMDYFGLGNNRRIPEGIKNQKAYKSTEGDKILFPSNFNPIIQKALPNTSFGLYAGNYFTLQNKSKIGYLISVNHGKSNAYEYGKYKLINTQAETKIDYELSSYSESTNSSILGNLFYELNDNHQLNYNLLLVNQSNDETRETSGFHFDYASGVYSRRYTYRQNSLLVNQLTGNHNFLSEDKLRITWTASINQAFNKEPDRRQLVYTYNDKEDVEHYVINARDRIDNHRFFSALNENQINLNTQAKYIIAYDKDNKDNGEKLSVTLGGFYKNKTRNFDYTQYVYDLGDINNANPNGVNVYNPDAYINESTHESGLYTISEALNPASAYEANQNIKAGYAIADWAINKKLLITAGARVENSFQTILYRDQTQPEFLRKNILSAIDLLPSFIGKYSINDKNIIRGSLSKTISRPGFKEVAPFEYIAIFAGAKTIGNPSLQNGTNYNADIRYEIYPTFGEFIAIGVFYKNLINPIEKTMEVTPSGQLQSFRNAENATVTGLEFEITKNLGFITQKPSVFNHLFLGMNATYLYSKVSFNKNINVAQTNSERSLQGASPYLVNVDFTYAKNLNDKIKTSYTLSYNVFGKRIYNVGIQGIGDVYEMPVNALNFITSVEVGKYSFGLKIKNILNPSIKYIQKANNQDFIVNQTKRGVFTSFSVGYTF